MNNETPRGYSLHTKILFSLFAGAALGSVANRFTDNETTWLPTINQYVLDPIGQVFLRMLFMTVIPLVFSSLALGVAQLGGRGDLGRIGLKTMAFFLSTMTCAVLIGLLLVNTIKPGEGLSAETKASLMEKYGDKAKERAGPTSFGIQTFIDIIPRNPLKSMVEMEMLAVISFALLVGVALTRIPEERAAVLVKILEGINDLMVAIIGWAMMLAPFGVFALIFSVTSQFGFAVMQALGWYVAVVLIGIALQLFGVLPLLLISLARYSPLKFFRRTRDVMITAFSTSSSNATLPTSIKTAEEELGVSSSITGFVLPLGATMNMNGTALFEGVTVVFLAQVFGVDLSLSDQLIVIVLAVLTAVGAAGVPGGSLPLLALVLNTVHVPSAGIALILGVDRVLDMCRTTLNVTADVVGAVCIAHSEGELTEPDKLIDL